MSRGSLKTGGGVSLGARFAARETLIDTLEVYDDALYKCTTFYNKYRRSRIRVRPTALLRYHAHMRCTFTFDLDL